MFKTNRILVPVDFSKESELALDWAGMLAQKEEDCTVFLFHVLPILPDPGAVGLGGLDYLEVEEDTALAELSRWQKKLPKGVMSSVSCEQGRVAEEVAKVCGEKRIDLVIMTTHGRKGLSHMLHGSAAEETVRLASCPVLVLHLNQTPPESGQTQRPERTVSDLTEKYYLGRL